MKKEDRIYRVRIPWGDDPDVNSVVEFACFELERELGEAKKSGKIPFSPDAFTCGCGVEIMCRYDDGSDRTVREIIRKKLSALKAAGRYYGWHMEHIFGEGKR